jgi:hypothetical protein
MKKTPVLLLYIAAVCFLGSCKDDETEPEKDNEFYGTKVSVGNGEMRSWLKVDDAGQPLELGITITPGALENLPAHAGSEPHPYWTIPFNQKVLDLTPFNHLTVNWNPAGHPPDFFAAQHFDFHFYLIEEEERYYIPAWSPDTDAQFNTYPPAGYMPEDYSAPPGAVGAEPAMGKHWLPPPPSFLPFSHVMILGTFDGSFNFIEPMVTMDYLKKYQPVSKDFSQPQKFAKAGFYPTKYNILKDVSTGNRLISLSGFVWRNAH